MPTGGKRKKGDRVMRKTLPMNLQFFAEGGDGNGDQNAGSNNNGQAGQQGNQNNQLAAGVDYDKMNNIELSTIYLPILDEVYKEGAKTSVLDGDETTVRKGNNGEIKIAKLDMDALGDFDRKSGYTKGSTSLTWETVKYDKERSQDLRIDRLDNDETLVQPFAKLSSEFLRTKVIPETDAARIAKICGTKDITVKEENIETGAELITALRACANKMDEDEVPMESRILFITPTLVSLADDMDTTKSREVLKRFSQIISVPQSRMYTSITLHDGKNSYGYEKTKAAYTLSKDTSPQPGKTYYTKESEGNYKAVSSPSGTQVENYEMTTKPAKNVNFLCVEKSAAVTAMDQYIKYFSPDQDQDGDSHVFKYRNNNLYGHVYENKTAGVYVSHKDN